MEKDPNYALAYAGLANTYNFLGQSGYDTPSKVWQNAKTAAMQAVQLDDQLPEAHIALALVRANYDWDWAGAESEFRKAIQLNGNSATAHHWYADFLTRMGRFEEAKLELKKAQELDPLSLLINTSIGRQLLCLRGSTTPPSSNCRRRWKWIQNSFRRSMPLRQHTLKAECTRKQLPSDRKC